MKIVLFLCWSVAQRSLGQYDTSSKDRARQALEYVDHVATSTCSGGVEETLPIQFDHTVWERYAAVAVNMANLLTKIIIQGNNSIVNSVADEFFFNLVRTNVDGDGIIFGSGICVEKDLMVRYPLFCAYAYKKDYVYAHDLSLNYYYLDAEYIDVLRQVNWTSDIVTVNKVTYRHNISSHALEHDVYQPMARLEHGHWTAPYFDCGGGDIWMTTYSAPLFQMDANHTPIFAGIGTIDVELTEIDINQCDATDINNDQDTAHTTDVFRGTHNCQPSTYCIPKTGRGFRRGAYTCVCEKGFYFPDLSSELKEFSGDDLEKAFASNMSNSTGLSSQYVCLPCAVGCDACIDDSPCLYSHYIVARLSILIGSIVVIIISILSSIVVLVFSNRKAVKSASPIFLHLMTFGAMLMCLPMLLMYAEPTDVTCALRIWPRHIGFVFSYGGLLLKTWRITAIFKVKSAMMVQLSDRRLLHRFIPLLVIVCCYLAAWTSLDRSVVMWKHTTSDNSLKFTDCSSSSWAYGASVGEACFLLWGCYLCYVVRKVPSDFNESKYITWTIYNNILLGSFVIIIRELIAVDLGPDMIYLVDFLYLQVSVTSMIAMIFTPKFYAVFSNKHDIKKWNGRTMTSGNTEDDGTLTRSSITTSDIGIQTCSNDMDDTEVSTISHSHQQSTRINCRFSNKVSPID